MRLVVLGVKPMTNWLLLSKMRLPRKRLLQSYLQTLANETITDHDDDLLEICINHVYLYSFPYASDLINVLMYIRNQKFTVFSVALHLGILLL